MNQNDPFKYHSLDRLKQEPSPLIYFITEEMVQDFAETNYGRWLNEEEVSHLFEGFCEDDHDYLYSFMDSAVEYVLGEGQARELWAKAHQNHKHLTPEPVARYDSQDPLLQLPLIYVSREVVQTFAIAKYGRKLTTDEMRSLVQNLQDAGAKRLPSEIERQMQFSEVAEDMHRE